MSMNRSYCRRILVVALAFVFALSFAAAHGSSSPSPSSVPGVGSPSAYSAIGAGMRATAQENPVSVEDLGRGVIAALGQGSFDALVPYLPTAEDFQEVIAKMVEDGEMTEEQAQQNLSQIPAIIEAAQASFREDYANVQANATYEELSWEEVEITGYRINLLDFDTQERREVDTATLAALDAGQMLQADIAVRFSAAGAEHELSLGNCIRTSRGWTIMERLVWSAKR